MFDSPNQSEEEHVRKRRRLGTTRSSFDSDHGYQQVTSTIQLSCEQYTVGWICALPVELTAAKAMLDIEYLPPQTTTNHHNVYTVGAIGDHNVVIACLPYGQYGTTAAAVVAGYMMDDFKLIKIPLIVGIGGGVPTPEHDIRLGDVIVSTSIPDCTAVVQYDFGKTGANGVLARKGSLNKPKTILSQAAAKMKATHHNNQSRVSEYISKALKRLSSIGPAYAYPGTEFDEFYELMCDFDQGNCSSSSCAGERLSTRSIRTNSNPHIHYGPIASGNSVMKDAHTRNRLTKDVKAICFEMEAAGVMDEYQCLVIRGICDYCDAHKAKQFQGYAAVAAAAVAKEVLSMLPPTRCTLKSLDKPQAVSDEVLDHRKAALTALDFEEWHSKRATVTRAHKQTCRWFLEQQEYLDWLNKDAISDENRGLFWIKGKPGTGKSTLMKFVSEEVSKQKAADEVVISFFFNARGHDLEKSIAGMYRALVCQLLNVAPELQSLLDRTRSDADFENQFTLEFLQSLFISAIRSFKSNRLICFVDALDECPEDQIRSMVDFFSELGEIAASRQVAFHVLFSSRHYPNITINTGRTMILEIQDGHSQDIARYINAELRIGKNKQAEALKEQVLSKSSGIFLWVVLVVRILRETSDKGRVRDLEKKLREIPTELNALFRDIILRDAQRLPDFVLCMQWVLYAARPLRREELYFALLAGDDSAQVPQWDSELEPPAVMDHRILDTSKGLVELTRSKKPTAQFIHESVREFLSEPGALNGLFAGFPGISEGQSHQRLRECCKSQISSDTLAAMDLPKVLPPAKSQEVKILREKAEHLFPFLEYAVEYVLHHAELAEDLVILANEFSQTLFQGPWAELHDAFQKHDTRRFKLADGETGVLLHYLAEENMSKIFGHYLSLMSAPKAEHEVQQAATSLLKAKRFEEFAQFYEMFSVSAKASQHDDPTIARPSEDTRLRSRSAKVRPVDEHNFLSTALDWYAKSSTDAFLLFFKQAVRAEHEAAVTVACRKDPQIGKVLLKDTRLFRTASESIWKIMIAEGLDVNAQGGDYGNALQFAAYFCLDSIVGLLIDAGAKINAHGGYYGNALQAAVAVGSDSIVTLLIEAKADVNAQGGHFGSALQAAAERGHDAIVRSLIDAGGDVNAQGGQHGNALQAARNGYSGPHISTIQMLIEAGAV